MSQFDFENGVLSDRQIAGLADSGAISASVSLTPGQIQPASLDLRLGTTAYRVRASFLPGSSRTVTERLADFTMHQFDLTEGAVLELSLIHI